MRKVAISATITVMLEAEDDVEIDDFMDLLNLQNNVNNVNITTFDVLDYDVIVDEKIIVNAHKELGY